MHVFLSREGVTRSRPLAPGWPRDPRPARRLPQCRRVCRRARGAGVHPRTRPLPRRALARGEGRCVLHRLRPGDRHLDRSPRHGLEAGLDPARRLRQAARAGTAAGRAGGCARRMDPRAHLPRQAGGIARDRRRGRSGGEFRAGDRCCSPACSRWSASRSPCRSCRPCCPTPPPPPPGCARATGSARSTGNRSPISRRCSRRRSESRRPYHPERGARRQDPVRAGADRHPDDGRAPGGAAGHFRRAARVSPDVAAGRRRRRRAGNLERHRQDRARGGADDRRHPRHQGPRRAAAHRRTVRPGGRSSACPACCPSSPCCR